MANLFDDLPQEPLPEELFETLAASRDVRIERIVSTGQATPPGRWEDQETDEWVVLLKGAAGLRFESEARTRDIGPGDHVLIPAHCRHRVEWTKAGEPTVWLAMHFR